MACMYCGRASRSACCSVKCENKYLIYKYRSSKNYLPQLMIADAVLFIFMRYSLVFLAESLKNETLYGKRGVLIYTAFIISLNALYFFLYPYTFKLCRITRRNKALSFLFGAFLIAVSAVLISL